MEFRIEVAKLAEPNPTAYKVRHLALTLTEDQQMFLQRVADGAGIPANEKGFAKMISDVLDQAIQQTKNEVKA